MLKNEKAAKLFESAASLPQIKSLQSCVSVANQFLVTLVCGAKDYSVDKKEKLYQQMLLDNNGILLSKAPYLPASDDEQDCYIDGNFKVSLISTGKDEKRLVKVYHEDGTITVVNVTKDHGPFYADQISVSSSRKHICYVAQPPALEDDLKFHFKCDPGEGYTGRKPPAAIVLDLMTKKVKVLTFDSLYAVTHPFFDPKDEQKLFFIGVQNLPTRLGIRYCTNRSSFLYQCKTDGSGLEKLSGKFGNARFPLITPNKEHILFLSNQIGGPHDSCARLISFDLKTKKEIVIVDRVRAAKSSDDFPGLFVGSGLQPNCWINDCVLIVCSLWRSKSAIVAIDISNGNVTNLTASGSESWSLLRVAGSQIFATCSSISSFPKLGTKTYGIESNWKFIDSTVVPTPVQTLLDTFKYKIKDLSLNVEVILIESSVASNGLIVMPHGGLLTD
jgi:Acylamino-acid-releasing enzyme, N-terminal domain